MRTVISSVPARLPCPPIWPNQAVGRVVRALTREGERRRRSARVNDDGRERKGADGMPKIKRREGLNLVRTVGFLENSHGWRLRLFTPASILSLPFELIYPIGLATPMPTSPSARMSSATSPANRYPMRYLPGELWFAMFEYVLEPHGPSVFILPLLQVSKAWKVYKHSSSV